MCMEKVCSQADKASRAIQDVQNDLGKDFKSRIKMLVENEIANFDSRIKERKEKWMTSEAQFFHKINPAKSNTNLINVQYASEGNCNITGMVKYDEARIAVADYNNKSVKMVNVTENTIDDRLEVSGWPLDIACIEDNFFVIVHDEKKLLFLRFDCSLHEVKTLDLCFDSFPKGIDSIDKGLVVSFSAPDPCVRIITQDGDTLWCFNTGLKNPSYVTTDIQKSVIFIADVGTNYVHSFSLTEQESHRHTDKKLQYPLGLTIDNNGNVYVADLNSHCIYRISPGGDLQALIIGSDLIDRPRSIVYCKTENRIYIGCKKVCGQRNLILGYQLS